MTRPARCGPRPHGCGVIGCVWCEDATRRAARVERGRAAIETALAPFGSVVAAERAANIAQALDGATSADDPATLAIEIAEMMYAIEIAGMMYAITADWCPWAARVLCAWIAAEHEPDDEAAP